MLASITPLGERGRASTWAVTVTAFALGATAAGAGAGALVGALGAWALPHGPAAPWWLAGLAALIGTAALVDGLVRAVPGPRRQVDERWLDEYRGWVYGLGFGAQLGLGFTTVVTSAATYAAFAAALLARSPLAGAIIGGCFGAVRGVTPLAAARVHTPPQLMALHAGLARWRSASRWTAVAALAALTVLAAGEALA